MSFSCIFIFWRFFFETWPPWLSPTSNLRKALPGEASRSTLTRCRRMVQWDFLNIGIANGSLLLLSPCDVFKIPHFPKSSKRWWLSTSLILFCLLRHTFRTCEVLVGLYDIHRSWTKSVVQCLWCISWQLLPWFPCEVAQPSFPVAACHQKMLEGTNHKLSQWGMIKFQAIWESFDLVT